MDFFKSFKGKPKAETQAAPAQSEYERLKEAFEARIEADNAERTNAWHEAQARQQAAAEVAEAQVNNSVNHYGSYRTDGDGNISFGY